MNLIQTLEQEEITRLNKTVPLFAPGDTVVVNVNVVEGERKRVQAYEGVVIAKRNRGPQLVVRRAQDQQRRGRGTDVPDVFAADRLDRGQAPGDVRRAKLYYLRDRSGKSARIREKLTTKAKPAE